jgi:hypothetical protein
LQLQLQLQLLLRLRLLLPLPLPLAVAVAFLSVIPSEARNLLLAREASAPSPAFAFTTSHQ